MKVSDIESNAPIRTADNKFGTVIRFDDDQIGVQVPNEEDIRWIPIDKVGIVGYNGLQEKVNKPLYTIDLTGGNSFGPDLIAAVREGKAGFEIITNANGLVLRVDIIRIKKG